MRSDRPDLRARLGLKYNTETYRRDVGGMDVIIHCHHYNSRVQRVVEGSAEIDGKAILVSTAEAVFSEYLGRNLRDADTSADMWAMAECLYAHLGYGRLDLSSVEGGEIEAQSSHFVEGWSASFGEERGPVCSFTEGYLQGVIHRITGELVQVREVECMVTGASRCRFQVEHGREEPVVTYSKASFELPTRADEGYVRSANVDEVAIVEAIVSMQIEGNDDGLIPAFSVYLANTPADFYNLLALRFIEAMAALGREKTARRLLVNAGEICAMNTFRGIMNSTEWEGLVQPMIGEQSDKLHGLMAVSNALGWGNWHIRRLVPGVEVEIESLNGYEALGLRELRGAANRPQCCMLTGVAAGLMELVYGEGTLDERFGTFAPVEDRCICCDDSVCHFHAERVTS